MTPPSLFRLVAVFASALTLPLAAAAQQAVAAKSINVRAGPGRDYPLVLQVGGGTPLAVQGCIENYSWCDVVVPGNNRGWVYAGNISYPYQSNAVPVLEYGAAIGLPIVGFVLGSYWGDYYRNRPFYGNRSRWEHRPVPHGPAFRPPRAGFGHPGPGFGQPGPGVRPSPGRPGDFGRPGRDGRPPGDQRGRPGMAPGGGRPGGDGRPGGGMRPDGGTRPDGGGRPGGGARPDGGGRPGGGGGDHGRGGDHGGRPGR